jgi:hypothetical protein
MKSNIYQTIVISSILAFALIATAEITAVFENVLAQQDAGNATQGQTGGNMTGLTQGQTGADADNGDDEEEDEEDEDSDDKDDDKEDEE